LCLALAVIPALAGCEKQREQARADMHKGAPEDLNTRKAVEAAAKEGEERRREETEK
jgi:hypothetical protein